MQTDFTLKRVLRIAGRISFTIAVTAFFLAIFKLGFGYEQKWEEVVLLFFGLTILIGFCSILLGWES